MKSSNNTRICVAGLALFCAPAYATVHIQLLKPSLTSPQAINSVITWKVSATDTNSNQVTFQFNVAPPGGSMVLVKDFNAGALKNGSWIAQPFAWMPETCQVVPQSTGVSAYTCQPMEGQYKVQVVAEDFTTGESDSKTVTFQATPLVTGSTPVVVGTTNPLVALFSAPSCAAGSQMRISFQQQSGATPAMTTNYVACHPPATMTFEIAGMYPSTTYEMFSQTNTGGTVVNGPTETFTTGALPSNITFPNFDAKIPPGSQTDTTDGIIFHGSATFPNLGTDLTGDVLWYYNFAGARYATRPLQNGTFLTIAEAPTWNQISGQSQIIRQVDLAGNIVRETNTGIIQHQLVALGATDGGACDTIPKPPAVGAACVGHFHHDFIQTLPGGYSAALMDVEKIFPAGTQGNTTGLPVDIVGDMIVVLDTNWQVVWWWDSFDHDSGAPQLDINRPAVLGETCVNGKVGCTPTFLLGKGIAPTANDWLHANTLYYWPAPQNGTSKGDILWSSRHQDWVMKIDYQDGTGTGNILWRMGNEGDFTFNNVSGDPWPWFSHQHEIGIEDNGSGVVTLFDNGNTRVSPPPLGLGKGNCAPHDCNSRGFALNLNESSMQVTPVLMADLGVFAPAKGSAQLLSNGNYFFVAPLIKHGPNASNSDDIEILPNPGKVTGKKVLELEAPDVYRSWQVPDMYTPPIT